ncbi:MAG TPA: hypothetical protein VMT32_09455 [Bryobacteraceae bacterium]|nr:hypothetical protein [Bryobacteraceae bacterium]
MIFPGTGQPPPNGLISGRVLFPGTGGPPGSPLSITDTTFASRLGETVSGLNGGYYNGGYYNGQYRRFRRRSGGGSNGYPVYGGGYYVGDYSDFDYGYAPDQSNAPMVNPSQPGPQVIINQNFVPEHANPVVHEYGQDSSGGIHLYEAPSREPEENGADENTSYYLIAFKDHSIYSAYAYWVEGDTLHYVTPQRVHNQASLSLVDRELTEKLNRNQNMQVKLPPAK